MIVRKLKEALDFLSKIRTHSITTNTNPPQQHSSHSHCYKCDAETHNWCEETKKWICSRCAAAKDYKRVIEWCRENCNDEIQEGRLSDNVIRMLSERTVIRREKYLKQGKCHLCGCSNRLKEVSLVYNNKSLGLLCYSCGYCMLYNIQYEKKLQVISL